MGHSSSVLLLLIPNLALASFADLKSRRIPNVISFLTACEILILSFERAALTRALIFLTVVVLLREIFKLSIGYGDIKYATALTLNSPNLNALFTFLNVTCASALAVLLFYRIIRGRWLKSVPLAPFLSLGAVICHL